MTLQLVAENDPVLRQICEPFDFANPPLDPAKLSYDMLDCMQEHEGVGLAAPQVGLLHRVFVMAIDGETFACFNPEVVSALAEGVRVEEGCLSFPKLFIKVARPLALAVRYQDANGDYIEKEFINLHARCFAHELDHLDGICFVDRVGPLARKMAQDRRKKILKGLLQNDSSRT